MEGGNNEEVRYGEVSLITIALKRVYDGLSALKISMDMLNDRVLQLSDLLEKYEEMIKETQALSKANREEIEKMLQGIKETAHGLEKDLKITLDAFLDKFEKQINALSHILQALGTDIATLKSDIKGNYVSTLEVTGEVKNELLSLKSEISELKMILADHSTRLNVLEEDVKNRLHELELLIASLSTDVAAVKKLVREAKEAH